MKIYVASSVSLYADKHYNQIIEIVERLYPADDIVYARGLYNSQYQFDTEYTGILDTCDMLVFFVTPGNRTIGRGTSREIGYARYREMPVYLLTWSGKQVPFSNLSFEPVHDFRSYKNYKRVGMKTEK